MYVTKCIWLFLYIYQYTYRDNYTTTGAKLLDIKYKFYLFSDDRDPLTNQYQYSKEMF